jgi:predicted alpha/beta hydrolase family esterase
MEINIIPGINNSGPEHWQTYWEHQYGFTRIEQEDWDHPVYEKWKEKLVQSVTGNKVQKNTILIAHSLGCLLTVKALPEIQDYLSCIYLVAVPDPSMVFFSGQLQTFRNLPDKNLKVPGYLVYSENDPYSSIEFSVRYSRIWGLKAINAGRKGHLNSDSRLGVWEEGYEIFRRLLKEIQPEP